jgi:hypothetical protein
MKPNLFEVYVDGEMLNQDAATSDQQKFLEQTFLNLTINHLRRLLFWDLLHLFPSCNLPLHLVVKSLKILLDIQVFSTMNNNLKDRMKQLNDDIRFTEKDLDLVKHRIETQES